MTKNLPSRREMKFLAKRLMIHPLCIRVTLLLVGLEVACYGLRYLLGATLTYGLMDLTQYGDTVSGIYWNQEGVSILFRMDLTQMILAIPLTYQQIFRFFLVGAIFFVILSPLRLGAMEGYWSVLRGDQQRTVYHVFQWFRQPRRLGKALVVEFVLGVVVRAVGALATVPSLYLFYLFYTTTPTVQAYTTASSLLQMGATWRRDCLPSGCTASFCRCATACAPIRSTPWGRPSAGACRVPGGCGRLSSCSA